MSEESTCLDCRYHLQVQDSDPHDWFCDDDQAVLCKLKPKGPDPSSIFIAEQWPYKAVTVGCRPYNLKKEAKIPDWCPFDNQEGLTEIERR